MKAFFLILLRLLFRFRAENSAVLETAGPIMLLPNHSSWVDWLFVAVCLDKSWRFVTSKEGAEVSFVHRLIMINRFTFPVETDSPYAVKRIAEYLQSGGKLVIFPEGRLSRTGSLMKLFEGTGFLLLKTNAKVITCYLRGAYRLPFSKNPDRKQCFPNVSAHFSAVLNPPKFEGISAIRARQRLTRWLYDAMAAQRFAVDLAASPANVSAAIVETARRRPSAVALQDVTHTKLSYRRLLAGTAALAG
jgi:acyl-[acyl-carrier-protein]-phospholipid O-acyltransferase/long-chain-fatty-acid--[acyl-carrier-protein] ligase